MREKLQFCFRIIFVILFAFFSKNSFAKVIDVGMSPDYPPFEFTQDGKIVGYEVDILNEIEKITDLKFNIKRMAFEAILAGVIFEKVQIGVSAFTNNPEREKNVDFSEAVAISDKGIISRNEDNFKSLQDLKNKIVLAQSGTLELNLLKNLNKKEKLNIIIIPISNNFIALQMLKNKKADAFFSESATALFFVQKNQDLSANIIDLQIKDKDKPRYAFIFKKNSKLKIEIDYAILKLKQEGKIDIIYKKWFGDIAKKEIKHEQNNTIISIIKNKILKIKTVFKTLLKGSVLTIKASIISIFFGMIIATFISISIYSKFNRILNKILSVYISFTRGTPIMVQFGFWFFLFPLITKIKLTAYIAGIVTLSLNSGAYISEIIRGGLNAFDNKQIEACIALNLSKFQMYKDIIIPQVLRNIIPMLINEFITLIKESSILSIFGVEEIMMKSNIVISETYDYYTPIISAAILYYIICFSLERIGKFFEKRYSF